MATGSPPRPLLRDQQRALHAYEAVEGVPRERRKEYRTAVNDLGAHILRNGLCAAIAGIQRLKGEGDRLLDHLARAGIPGLDDADANDLPRRVRELDTDAYIMATREALRVAMWLKRAVQATYGDLPDA